MGGERRKGTGGVGKIRGSGRGKGKGMGWDKGKGIREMIGWEGLGTFEEGSEVVDLDVLGFDTFEEVEEDLDRICQCMNGIAEEWGR